METDETTRVKIEKLEWRGNDAMGNSSGNEGKREMGGREIERTWKLKKNSGREYLEYVGERGQVFIVTVFRVLNVGECSNA